MKWMGGIAGAVLLAGSTLAQAAYITGFNDAYGVADFSGTNQGTNGWYYLSSPGGDNNWSELTASGGVWGTTSTGMDPYVASAGNKLQMLPGYDNVNITWVAAKWVSTMNADLTIDGAWWRSNGAATGELFQNEVMVRVNGVTLGSTVIDGSTSESNKLAFSYNVTVNAGDAVEFIVNPLSNNWADETLLQVAISGTPVPEPASLAVVACGLGLLIGKKFRK